MAMLMVASLLLTAPVVVECSGTIRAGSANPVTVSQATRRMTDEIDGHPQKPGGDEACPCLTADQLEAAFGKEPLSGTAVPSYNITVMDRRPQDDSATYGLGCAAHSLYDAHCQEEAENHRMEECHVLPTPASCQNSNNNNEQQSGACHRHWCYVNRNNCHLRAEPTQQDYRDVRRSYATCGHMDEETHAQRLEDLADLKPIRTGFNSNTGGWMGAYNPEGSFALSGQDWTGPMVEFVTDAARQGNFSILPSAPPAWLINESAAFWGTSTFNLCVYAVSLGYLDMCVSDLTITPERAAVTPFFELDSGAIYLFVNNVSKIYQPFDPTTWMFVFLFCIPILGMLMLFHEYDSPGTAFSKKKDFRVRVNKTQARRGEFKEAQIQTRSNPMWKHTFKAIYIAFLAFFVRGYRVRVFSVGGKFHLLAIMCFILLTTTVYTANLAAQFVQDSQRTPVKNLEEALQRGYTFCSERKAGQIVMDLYGIDESRIIVDPTSEGGDGKPGFACPNCQARTRVFDFMSKERNNPDLYCDAAFVLEEDLAVLQEDGGHCNKTIVGSPLTRSHRGFALNERIAESVTSHFYALKAKGVLEQHYHAAQPQHSCPTLEGSRKGTRLTIQDMSGIWVAAFGLAVVGLVANVLQRIRAATYQRDYACVYVDQWGNAIPNPKAMEQLGVEDMKEWSNPASCAVRRMEDASRQSCRNGDTVYPVSLDPRLQRMVENCGDLNNLDE